ncbi:glycosyltransferase [Streptomyces sp. NPDC086554]|uniref:glycosyltransferase n=1 Tax=Streptomyces sp. NPDC086554 TaxID=3154864 RepID=UPI00344065DF
MSHQITFLAFGSRGDTQPYLPVGQALEKRGHHVRIATGRIYADLVHDAGLEHIPIDLDVSQVLSSSDGQQWLGAERNPLRLAKRLRPLTAAYADQVVSDMADACASADAVVCSVFGMMFRPVIVPPTTPFCYGGLQPMYPTRDFPTIQLSHRRSLGGPGNRWSHRVVENTLWRAFRSALVRRSAAGRRVPLRAPTAQLRRAGHPLLYGFSPTVVPRPADWPSFVHVTGYWFTELSPSWAPSPELSAFLDSGPPPVFVGFGSMVPNDPRETGQLVRTALRRAGLRGVLLGDPATEPSDDEFHVISGAPHQWLFPRMAAVVHHGGAGTTAAGLRAGVPQVITPFFLDQPFWGERLAALGVGTPPQSIHHLSADGLSDEVRRAAAADGPMRERAHAVQEQVAAERGAERAAVLLEQWLARVR